MTDYQALLTSFNELQPCGLLTAREPVDLEHAEAKELLQEMVRNHHLDRKANGQYYVTTAGALYLQDADAANRSQPVKEEKPHKERIPDYPEPTPVPEKTTKTMKPRSEDDLPEVDHVSTDELIEIIKNGQQAKELLKQRLLDVGIIL